MQSDDIAGTITHVDANLNHTRIVEVRADGTIVVEGVEGSPAMAEAAIRRHMTGDDLERSLAFLRNLTTVQ